MDKFDSELFLRDIKNIVSSIPSDLSDSAFDYLHSVLVSFAYNLRREIILTNQLFKP